MQLFADFFERSCCMEVLYKYLDISNLHTMRQKVRAKMQQICLFFAPFYP